MKTTKYVMTILFAGIMATGSGVAAQTDGSNQMTHGSTQQQKMDTKQGMMGGQGMGAGMMESCQEMMGSGMMGGGDGMGDMHHGMMGMMDGMDEFGAKQKMMGFKSSEEFEKFLDDTKEERRKLHNLRFEYGEKKRQPETTIGELKEMKKEMADLTKQIHEKVVK